MGAEKFLFVDGSNLLFQMFFGMPARIKNKSGKAIHGTIGFIGALRKIIRMTSPTHIAVLFDGECENVRTALCADYKSNRIDYGNVPEDENPYGQLADIYAALDYLAIKHAETTVCETDDWIAGYALTYGKDAEIVISSLDSDFYQLVTDNVSVLRYRGVKTTVCTPESVFRRFGIAPVQYADFKSLVGDPSDNIRGAEKIGPKTAALLLNRYGSLDRILENAAQIERPSVRASVTESAERLRTNYRLIRLEGGAALPFRTDELSYTETPFTTNDTLKGIGLLP